MPKFRTWVVKIGGSLIGSPCLERWLQAIVDAGRRRRVVIVAGGGLFADAVRQAQESLEFDDDTAHLMALHAMRQFSYAIASKPLLGGAVRRLSGADALRANGDRPGVAIWDPLDAEVLRSSLPRSWQVSADSLSLWLAQRLPGASLLLVKSVVPRGLETSAATLARQSFIDTYFAELLRADPIAVRWLEKEESAELDSALDGQARLDRIIE